MIASETKIKERKFNLLLRNNGVTIEPDFSYRIPKMEILLRKDIISSGRKVNLYHLNCTCKKYRETVKITIQRDYRRICVHLYQKLYDYYWQEIDDLTRLILENSFLFGQNMLYRVKNENNEAFLGLNEICDVGFLYLFRGKWKLTYVDLKIMKIEYCNNKSVLECIDDLVNKFNLP